MSHVGRKHGRGAQEIIDEAKSELGAVRAEIHEQEIAALPTVQWKGRTLHTVRCNGTSGKGPHDVNLPLAMVWHLRDIKRFYCVYHAGDVWRAATA